MSESQLLLRLLVAAVLGSIVGLERERGEWAAGLRTHMLVSLGACLFMIVSAYGFGGVLGRPAVVLDPSRIAAQEVTGVGFLGAGTILMRGSVVRGLTTAASLWAVAAVGLATGGGLYGPAVATTALIVVILAGVKPLERRFFSSRRPRFLSLSIDSRSVSIDRIEATVADVGVDLRRLIVRRSDVPDRESIELTIAGTSSERASRLVEAFRRSPGVADVRLDPGHVRD